MLGTGESASSLRESTMPSWTSSSWTVGTYCRQIGSSGCWMRSTMAGEMRNSKFSAACFSRWISPTCSGPNRAASASSEAMPFLRSSSCQDSMSQFLEIDHHVVTGRVIPREGGGPGVAAAFVKGPRRRVIRAGRRLHDDQPAAPGPQRPLYVVEHQTADAASLSAAVHRDPVQVVRAFRPGGRTPAGVADQVVAVEGADEPVVIVALGRPVQQLDRDGHLARPEHPRPGDERLKPCAVAALE